MTPDRLAALLDDRFPSTSWPPVQKPLDLLRALEVAADKDPGDRLLSEAVVHVHALVSAGMGLPSVIGGVRRERVVRWDPWTVTFEGTHLQRASSAHVRTLRPHAAKDPVLRRALIREGKALGTVLPELEVHDGPQPALVVPLPGHVAVEGHFGTQDSGTRARVLEQVLAALRTWDEAGMGLPPLGFDELRNTGDRFVIVCLTATRDTDTANLFADVSALLDPQAKGGDTPVDRLVAGFSAFPPHSYSEARELYLQALHDHLLQIRQDLTRRAVEVSRWDRHGRLMRAAQRLHNALPPPVGRGHIGVNLDGVPTLVECDAGSVWWGSAEGELVAVYTPMTGFAPRDARRLLRAQANSPANPRLQEQVGGDAQHTEDICRWVAAGMQLRTIRLLLEATA